MRTHPQDCEDMRLVGVFGGLSRDIVQASTCWRRKLPKTKSAACAFDHVLWAAIGWDKLAS